MEMPAELQRERQQELDKIAKQYGGGKGDDMTAFPSFNFPGKNRI